MDNFTKHFGKLDIRDGDYISIEYIKRDGRLGIISGPLTLEHSGSFDRIDHDVIYINGNIYTVDNIRKIIRWEAYN